MKLSRNTVIMVAVLSLLGIFVIIFIFFGRTHTTNKTQRLYRIMTTSTSSLSLTGKVESADVRTLKLPSTNISKLMIKSGDYVTANQELLTTFDDKTGDIQKQKQEIDKQSRLITQYTNQLANLKSQATSENSVQDASTSIAQVNDSLIDAQTDLQNMKNDLNNTITSQYNVLKSPIDGRISVHFKDGIPSLTVYSNSKNAVGDVLEYDYYDLMNSSTVKIVAPATNKTTSTTVGELNFVSNDTSKNGQAEYSFSAPISSEYLDGQTLKILSTRPGIRIPTTSVVAKKYVYVYKNDGKVSKAPITYSEKNGYAIVNSGLPENVKIITDPDSNLRNNKKVGIHDWNH